MEFDFDWLLSAVAVAVAVRQPDLLDFEFELVGLGIFAVLAPF